jgi:hypothetical protein
MLMTLCACALVLRRPTIRQPSVSDARTRHAAMGLPARIDHMIDALRLDGVFEMMP